MLLWYDYLTDSIILVIVNISGQYNARAELYRHTKNKIPEVSSVITEITVPNINPISFDSL